ncbi:MAG TPA: HNH endonuclease [Candidatus Acidoferrales bacterium]|nr:HNH endonuclease [Candidatus Acidoferrales bacterium]
MGNQRLAAGKAHFRMTSKGGIYFEKRPRKYANLFTFGSNGRVILRPGVSESEALSEIEHGRPYRPDSIGNINRFPDEVEGKFLEGAVRKVTVNAYERDPRARRECIRKYGAKCWVCGLSFGKRYGNDFDDLIHVHHLRPLHQIGRQYEVDPAKDLRPICPNCHAVVHRRNPAFNIEEVRSFLRRKRLNPK